ncbi:hypothetical protein [Limisphaera sp. VF-2]|jgi:hypothetical protein|uniref:hypothetical protein n=1 Tax=Limisphaera sp. VF-2 TaxID=3400418 RepID=UPI0017627908|nr:hypothetical protein [Limisphaera sp.]
MNPVCQHLRTKKLYIEAVPDDAFSDPELEQAAPCHFWCNLTQTVVGPDQLPVHKNSCQPGRACFES